MQIEGERLEWLDLVVQVGCVVQVGLDVETAANFLFSLLNICW